MDEWRVVITGPYLNILAPIAALLILRGALACVGDIATLFSRRQAKR